MTRTLTACMPLPTHPEAAPDDAIRAAVGFAAGLGLALRVTTYAVDVPQMSAPFGNLLIDVRALVRATEEKSREEARRLQDLVRAAGAGGAVDRAAGGAAGGTADGAAGGTADGAADGAAGGAAGAVTVSGRVVVLGAATEAAAVAARYADLSVLPWSGPGGTQDIAQALVFGSGRPVIIVPATSQPAALDHAAIAWDGSRVAARALGDALALLRPGARVSVLVVVDEKPLGDPDLAGLLATDLQGRGFAAEPVPIALEGRGIAEALQAGARAQGAALLAMGGFGHSRLRDFILGGATRGVLEALSLPVLLSH